MPAKRRLDNDELMSIKTSESTFQRRSMKGTDLEKEVPVSTKTICLLADQIRISLVSVATQMPQQDRVLPPSEDS